MNVFITTQMRSGSTWLCDILATLFNTHWIFWEKGKYIKPKKFIDQIKNRGKNINIFKMHYTKPQTICGCIEKNDKQNFVISITRDLRDVAVAVDLSRYQ